MLERLECSITPPIDSSHSARFLWKAESERIILLIRRLFILSSLGIVAGLRYRISRIAVAR